MKRILFIIASLTLCSQVHAQTPAEEAQALKTIYQHSDSVIQLYAAHNAWVLCKKGKFDPQLFRSTTAHSTQVIADLISIFSPLSGPTAQALATYTPMADEVEENARNGERDLLKSKSYEAFLMKFITSDDVQKDDTCALAAGTLIESLVSYLTVRANAILIKK